MNLNKSETEIILTGQSNMLDGYDSATGLLTSNCHPIRNLGVIFGISITSRLDCCNSYMLALIKQAVQNAAAHFDRKETMRSHYTCTGRLTPASSRFQYSVVLRGSMDTELLAAHHF